MTRPTPTRPTPTRPTTGSSTGPTPDPGATPGPSRSPGIDHRNRLAVEVCGDHRAVEQIFERLEAGGSDPAATDPAQRQKLVEQAVTMLVTHTVAAEQVIFPVARRALSDGDELVDRLLTRSAEAEQTMKELEKREPDDPEFASLLTKVITSGRLQAQMIERMVLPRLAVAVGRKESEAAGAAFAAAKKAAPTRPHPAAPDTPPANLVNPLTGLVDRLRDTLSGRGM